MLWSPGSTQLFIRPLIDRLIETLQADWDEGVENPVHAEVNNDEMMVPYATWRRSKWINTLFPACSVIPRRTRTRQAEGGPLIDETHGVEVFIEDVGPNPDDLADSVMKRVQAAHIIIGRAGMQVVCQDYQPSLSLKPYWDAEHDYAQFFITKSSYKQNGSLILTFTGLMEKT